MKRPHDNPYVDMEAEASGGELGEDDEEDNDEEETKEHDWCKSLLVLEKIQ